MELRLSKVHVVWGLIARWPDQCLPAAFAIEEAAAVRCAVAGSD